MSQILSLSDFEEDSSSGGALPGNSLSEKFKIYDKENPQIYEEFKKISEDLFSLGAKHFGAKAILERIRFDTEVRALREPGVRVYKANNNYTAYYARKLILEDKKKWEGFFELRELLSV